MGEREPARRHIEQLIGWSDVVKASDEDIAWLYPDRSVDEVLEHWGGSAPRSPWRPRAAPG